MFWLECYQVLVRVGWIFKTETIIMPAVLDAVADSGLLRGLLPVLNRGGQSLPPIWYAGRLARRRRKRWSLVVTTASMTACFAGLALGWSSLAVGRPEWLAALFLAAYGLFAVSNGLNQLVVATLQGKLVPVAQRGRMMVVGVTVGSLLAILAAWWLLGGWLEEGPEGFAKIFGITAFFFGLASLVPLALHEPEDADPPAGSARQPSDLPGNVAPEAIVGARSLLADPALVRLCCVAALFSGVLILFPHYQAFARDRLGTRPASLLEWVIVQNVATGLASLVAGPLADRRGTRMVLVGLVSLSALTPLVVCGLSAGPREMAAGLFWLTYVPLGLNPVTLKILTNYSLELAVEPRLQPRYVSTVGAALAAPFALSPAVGWLVDGVGFIPVFLVGAAAIGCGGVVALGLPEPRRSR
jgi:MFS family permease